MSEQEQTFIRQLRTAIVGGVISFALLIIGSMFWFYTSANGRLKAIERTQGEKVNVTDFQNYQNYQDLKGTYLFEAITEIKGDIKEIKTDLKTR